MNLSTGSFSYAQQPQFDPTPRDGRYPVTINQNYVIGSIIIQVGCTDSLDNTTEFVYGIVPMMSENYFTINNVSGVVSLAINAHDLLGGGPHTAIIYCKYSDNDLTGTVQLAVTYQIQNIHVPMFTNGDQVLNVSVREDHTEREGPIIAHLNVTDEDLEPCNIVTFTIVSGNNDGNFRIRSQSGIIELNNDLDYDSHPEKYTLTIRATNTECGDQRYSDELTVCVNVISIDDEHPTFQQHMYNFTFDEGERPLDFVQLRCFDSDSPGAQIVYEEGYAQNENPFAISHQTGYVSATEILDYEQQISYNLTFTCYNVLKSNIRDTATVVVYLNPVNEHLPTVQPRISSIQLNYTAPIGTLLISAKHDHRALINMTATDDDDGLDHGKIQFTLGQNNNMYNSYFHMDSDSGDLTLIRQFDFDVCSGARITGFSLQIVVCDGLQNSSRYEMCPIATCFVVTSSTPDLCELMFVEKNYTITVSELALPESELLQVHCVVPGGGPLQHHTIEIIPPNFSLSQTLRINKDRVILQEPLDYELVQNFTIHLNCSDSSGGLSITSLFIQVFPENDNPPYFEKPLYFFTIILPSKFNEKVIGSITALDNDLQIGNDITYSLVRNEFFEDDLEYFIVNKLENGSAAISMIKYPSHNTHYVFDIIANDSINTAQSTVSVHILSVSGAEQCGTICIILLIILVTFMLITAAIVVLVCVRFCYVKKRKQQRPVSMANTMQLQDKSDTMGYCTIHQGNSLRKQKDEAFSQM